MKRQAVSDRDVRALLRLLAEAGHVSEFRLRHGDFVVEVRNPAANGIASEASPVAETAQETRAPSSWAIVRAPSAGVVRFVDELGGALAGARVSPQTIVCALESGGARTVIAAGSSGVVRAVLVDDREAVHAGQALVAIEAQAPE